MATRKKSGRGETVAAIDLGSNSFHMLVAREDGGELQIIDRLRDAVRLAAGLDDERHLSGVAQARALACLTPFRSDPSRLAVEQTPQPGCVARRRPVHLFFL